MKPPHDPLDTPSLRARLDRARLDQAPRLHASDTVRAVRVALTERSTAPDWLTEFARLFARPALGAVGLAVMLLLGAAALKEWREVQSTLDWEDLTGVSGGGRI